MFNQNEMFGTHPSCILRFFRGGVENFKFEEKKFYNDNTCLFITIRIKNYNLTKNTNNYPSIINIS